MLSFDQLRPTTLDVIKRLAKSIKKAKGIPYTQALNEAANPAGYSSYEDAQSAIALSTEPRSAEDSV